MNSYQRTLEERKQQHLLRTLPLPDPSGIDFFSNDYLGLAQSDLLQRETHKEFEKIPVQNGATGSRLLSGNSPYTESVEQLVATFHKTEAALIYPSGYAANLGLISSLATRETTLIMDELVHASLIDGARLGRSQRLRFKHNNTSNLRKILQETTGQKLVIVESVYSMDGDVCPLEEVAEACEENDAMLIVDEAHAMAVYGDQGEGLVQKLGLENKTLARIMTYGKGPGIHGAAVVGPHWLKTYQINFSRSLIFSTAPSPHHFAAISAMYKTLPAVHESRKALQNSINCFVEVREKNDGRWLNSNTQIQSLIVPGNEQVVALAGKLRDAGINALPIRKPSVAEGAERIRFCLHSFNTKNEIQLLFDTLS